VKNFYYILKGKIPIATNDVQLWGRWMEQSVENGNRIVKQEKIRDLWISTVFLGLDHQFQEGPPLLFETMVFWEYEKPATKVLMDRIIVQKMESLDEMVWRYSTWDEAEEGHRAAVKLARQVFLKEVNGN
jgi:hypothetical protein